MRSRTAIFWHIKYPMVGGAEGEFVGDCYHPSGDHAGRYGAWLSTRRTSGIKDLIGKMVILPLVDREIPVIADSYVDKEFGTGVREDHPGP